MENKYYYNYRYGNLVKYKDFILPTKIINIGENFCTLKFRLEYNSEGLDFLNESNNIKPISLTNDLINLYPEFILNNYRQTFKIHQEGSEFICKDTSTHGKIFLSKIEYFHQLQNLYSFLTGKELNTRMIYLLYKKDFMAILENENKFILECQIIDISENEIQEIKNRHLSTIVEYLDSKKYTQLDKEERKKCIEDFKARNNELFKEEISLIYNKKINLI